MPAYEWIPGIGDEPGRHVKVEDSPPQASSLEQAVTKRLAEQAAKR